MTAQQPDALRLAEVFERFKKSSHRWTDGQPIHMVVATELRRLHARVQELEAQQERKPKCWCTTCRPISLEDMRFVVCPECGNKRCPRAHNHEFACTNSNEPGQRGSSWEHVSPRGIGATNAD